MRVGVVVWPIEDWPRMRDTWRRVDQLGFDSAWLYDHLAWRGHTPWDEAYTSLAAAAAVTERVRLGTLVTSPNFRHPLPTAAQVRTLDRVSQGRLTLGIGSGGATHTSDGDVLGEDWTRGRRTRRFEEFVAQLDTLLTQSPASADGAFWRSRDVTVAPGQVQRPRVPFRIAAEGPRGMRLAARYGEGWIANPAVEGSAYDAVRAGLHRLREVCDREGRPRDELSTMLLTGFADDPWTASPTAFAETYERFSELGLDEVVLHLSRPGTRWEQPDGLLEQIAELPRTDRHPEPR